MSIGVPTTVDPDIENAVAAATLRGLVDVAAPGRAADEVHHVIKYTGARFGGGYPPGPNAVAAPGLHISPSPGFTWGAALYVCPVAYPISTAIYGRCGVVAELSDTAAWRIFDAADPASAGLYVQWVQLQPMYQMLTLTTHSQLANQVLRNMFRSRFAIDVVVFAPDEMNRRYTDRHRDRWFAISEWWSPRRLKTSGVALRSVNPRLCVVLAEEFEPTKSNIGRRALIGPTPHLAAMTPLPGDVLSAYRRHDFLWVGP